MSSNTQQIVQRLWNYCNILRDDGMSYGDYVEQLTYLLFLKMAYERTRPPYNQPSRIPQEYDWESLLQRDGTELEKHYRDTLESLGKEKGMLGIIFRKAQNKIQDPAKLRRLTVDLINQETWTVLDAHDYLMHHYELDREQKRFLKFEMLHGWEIVDNTARLCVMNLFLHGIG